MNLKKDRNDHIHRNSEGRIAPNYQKIKEKNSNSLKDFKKE